MIDRHTPGPWRPGTSGGAVVADVPIGSGPSGADDCLYYGGHLVAESIARRNLPIIAAAPLMLEALRAMTREHGLRGAPHDELLPADQQPDDVAQAMRAIALAEGSADLEEAWGVPDRRVGYSFLSEAQRLHLFRIAFPGNTKMAPSYERLMNLVESGVLSRLPEAYAASVVMTQLLRELVAEDGQQPGNADWARRVWSVLHRLEGFSPQHQRDAHGQLGEQG